MGTSTRCTHSTVSCLLASAQPIYQVWTNHSCRAGQAKETALSLLRTAPVSCPACCPGTRARPRPHCPRGRRAPDQAAPSGCSCKSRPSRCCASPSRRRTPGTRRACRLGFVTYRMTSQGSQIDAVCTNPLSASVSCLSLSHTSGQPGRSNGGACYHPPLQSEAQVLRFLHRCM